MDADGTFILTLKTANVIHDDSSSTGLPGHLLRPVYMGCPYGSIIQRAPSSTTVFLSDVGYEHTSNHILLFREMPK